MDWRDEIMADLLKQLEGSALPKPVQQKLEKEFKMLGDARAKVTQAEIGFMGTLRSLFAGKGNRRQPSAGNAGQGEKTAVKAGKKPAKTAVPGAGQWKCRKASCPHNKQPFKFKMHAVIHANASKHGDPIEVKGAKLAKAS